MDGRLQPGNHAHSPSEEFDVATTRPRRLVLVVVIVVLLLLLD
jgi:hypothetical protein